MENKMKKKILAVLLATSFSYVSTTNAAEVITFDEAINGIQSFSFDGNSDGLADVIFSTTDPFGFNTAGPGPNMLYITEPGLEGTTLIPEDLRVDFLGGAVSNIEFGFAVSDFQSGAGVTFSVFDGNNNLLNSAYQTSLFTDTSFGTSSFPEAVLSLNFPGVASYGVFDFDPEPSRYIIDNFTGTFDSASINVAPPGSLPETALLPDNTGDPFFDFAINVGVNGLGTEFPIFIDPDVAVAYEYAVVQGQPHITSVIIPNILPNGDGQFLVNLCGESTTYSLNAGTAFDLGAITGGDGADCFIISEIDTLEMLSPNDPFAFVTGLTFLNSGQVNVTQTPITTFVASPSAVPSPGTLALMLSSLFAYGFSRKLKIVKK
ncbi:hypothetical protein [Neptunomonas qingdaonensis]|uniref:PEP-CTERM protein-sorting domain-containing protein n=1 Tax=Neptunomonas qingdaonensis TaxID=1045558 RepID=A0A1I2P5D6_9GAMM|nr:hypothetical protein [Neptunomonas qingdaonensis]SFG11254.1 PEP-CTERM protein-sorting domain-containing protein [Neptunomonas qingdaonensis]